MGVALISLEYDYNDSCWLDNIVKVQWVMIYFGKPKAHPLMLSCFKHGRAMTRTTIYGSVGTNDKTVLNKWAIKASVHHYCSHA